MMSSKKTLKERLHAGEALNGCFAMLPSASSVEMLGYAGFDFVIIDREHGTIGQDTLEHMVRAAELSGLEALVRVSWGTSDQIQHALDCGASGILVPHVTTADRAQELASFAHYPPIGVRGIATTARAGRHGFITVPEHLELALRRTLVIVQIEDQVALSEVSAIASVPHIDGVFIGPADLSISMGHPGNPDHPTVAKAIDKIIADTENCPAKCASFARTTAEALVLQSEKGVGMICMSGTGIVSNALKQVMASLKP